MTMKVSEVMTEEVITVTPDADFKSIARLLQEYRINLLPVVDSERRVIGVVTEADLLTKVEWQDRDRPGRLERWLLLEDELRKAAGTTASQIMTDDVASIGPDVTVAHAAQLMLSSQVKDLPVVDEDNRLVGIVSRADLLKSFIRDDASIHREVVEDVLHGALALGSDEVVAVVRDGAVTLKGEVETRSLEELIVRLVGAVPGVVSVFSTLDGRVDDRHLKATPEPADNLTYSGPPLRG